jgi:hypothetical protein
MPGTRGSCVDLSAAHDLGNGYVLGAHVGHLLLRLLLSQCRRIDLRRPLLGLARRRHKDISGWMVGASYVGSDAQGRCANGEFYCFSGSLRSDGSGAVRAAAMRAGRWSSSRSVEASERAWRK